MLSYIAYGLQTSSVEYVKQVMIDFFTPEELVDAREVLWGKCDPDAHVLPKLIRRHSVSSPKGSALTATDLVDGIRALDEAGKMPQFVVDYTKLHRVPLGKPCETSSISIVERLNKLEARVAYSENLIAKKCNECILHQESDTEVTSKKVEPASNRISLQQVKKTLAEVAAGDIVPRPEDEFIIVQSKQSKKAAKNAKKKEQAAATRRQGTASASTDLDSGPVRFRMQITNVKPHITAEKIQEYIKSKDASLSDVVVEDRSSEGWDTKRFVLTFDKEAQETVMNPEFWPNGIYFNRWFNPRGYKQKESTRNG